MDDYKVLITTSGVGSRLGDLTKYTNKCLVRVGKKPAISYIIESYPEEIELVVTIGYFGNQVKDFLNLAYPNRKIKFIEVDVYEGDNSSLGYSMLKAKEELQCPFIFHASDTICLDTINPPTDNWLGTHFKENNSQYRTLSFVPFRMINEKGDLTSNFVYIGLAGIKDYELFWKCLEDEYKTNFYGTSLSDCHAINRMNVNWKTFEYREWLDVGNVSELKHARENIYDKFDLLDKVDESIFIFEDFVIKFFYNQNICINRVRRCEELSGLTPELINYTNNFYKYRYADGDLLSQKVNEMIFENLLSWSKKNLWVKHNQSENFIGITKKFYFDKTYERVHNFLINNNIKEKTMIINGIEVPPVMDLLDGVNRDLLCVNQPYKFHGDFILDNIIHKGEDDFVLLDWRQDFGGELTKGDIYYDLAKLNHNLIINHDIIYSNLFFVKSDLGGIKCDIMRSNNLMYCQEKLHKWIIAEDFDLNKVKILTAIIWLNMAPLHDNKIGEFLYYFGRYNLYKFLLEY